MNSENIKKHLEIQAEEAGCYALLKVRALNTLTHRGYYASDAKKSDGPFYCPECYSDVVLRKCIEKIDHFAHRSRLTPKHSAKESELHDTCKKTILEYLAKKHPDGNWEKERETPKNLEKNYQKLRLDISGRINGQRLAIEIQLSTLSIGKKFKKNVNVQKKRYCYFMGGAFT